MLISVLVAQESGGPATKASTLRDVQKIPLAGGALATSLRRTEWIHMDIHSYLARQLAADSAGANGYVPAAPRTERLPWLRL